jgi:hypothetical protein
VNGNGAFVEEQPYSWSQRWHDDPPVGREVFLGDGLVEIYIGRGIWQTVKARYVSFPNTL